jgi:hypothetical protein
MRFSNLRRMRNAGCPTTPLSRSGVLLSGTGTGVLLLGILINILKGSSTVVGVLLSHTKKFLKIIQNIWDLLSVEFYGRHTVIMATLNMLCSFIHSLFYWLGSPRALAWTMSPVHQASVRGLTWMSLAWTSLAWTSHIPIESNCSEIRIQVGDWWTAR